MAGEIERDRIFSFVEDRFGIPQKAFADYLLFKGSRGWALLRNDSRLMAASQLKVCKAGLKAFRKVGRYIKPTSRMMQIFGNVATKGKILLTDEELAKLSRRKKVAVRNPMTPGYVILVLGGMRILGLGFVDEDGLLRSELPHNARLDQMF